MGQKRWRPERWLQGGETEEVAEKVVAVEIIEKANPRYREGRGQHCKKEKEEFFWEFFEGKCMGGTVVGSLE